MSQFEPRLLEVCLLVVGLSLFLAVPGVCAQTLGDVAIVPIGTTASLPDAIRLAESLDRLAPELGLRVISMHDARDRFVGRSRAAQTVSTQELDTVASLARQATEHVAFGRADAAKRDVRELILRAERALETLNRETATARHLLDACLSLVRSALQQNDREAARAQAMRCRRLVPDLAPNAESHPVAVIGVLAEADHLLQRLHIGRLSVRTAHDERCSVFLNGRHVGTTPFDIGKTAAGEYRVQVECGEAPGRVHIVQLGDDPVTLRVDPTFDRVVHTEPRLALRYERDERLQPPLDHALELGSAVGAGDLLLVQVLGNRARLQRMYVERGRFVASASVAWDARLGPERDELQRAVVALTEGRSEQEESENPIAAVAETSEPSIVAGVATRAPAAGSFHESQPARVPRRPKRPSRWRTAIDISAVISGAASFAIAGAYMHKRRDAGDLFRKSSSMIPSVYALNLEAWESSRAKPYAFAAAGAVLLAGGALDLLLGAEGAWPRWAVVASGIAGLGLASWGVTEIVRGGACTGSPFARKGCSDDLERRDRGALGFLGATAPLTLSVAAIARTSNARRERGAWMVLPQVDRVQASLSLSLQWF